MSSTPSEISPQQTSDDLDATLSDLRDRLGLDAEKKQLDALKTLETLGAAADSVLMDFLSKRHGEVPSFLDGKAYQILRQLNTAENQAFLAEHFPQGLLALDAHLKVDLAPLQTLLATQQFEEADRLTLKNMCELAGSAAAQRGWLYYSEVNKFPVAELKTIDTLWNIYSEGKFGFSVQRELWLTLGQSWERLWPKINWRSGNAWTRYPNEFTWDLTAPKGHLPLSNQLRGVRVMEALMKHPAWSGA
ncbi:MAG: GUN4 N-terminal ARM-like repeat domain-containing protein [Elainellaceae cyanobacterium]